MKSPYDVLARFAPKPTAEDAAAAQRLGVTVAEYQAAKLEVLAEEARRSLPADNRPADIVREERIAARLRREPGLVKRRDETPNVFVQAARTPGEVAQTLLFVLCYVVGLCALVIVGGESVTRLPGVFQCGLLGLLILPAMWVARRLWTAIGEGARDLLRGLVRSWPVTLLALIFFLGLLRMLFTRVSH